MGSGTMLFQIPDPGEDPRALSHSVLQAGELLGLYQAELARILHLQCGDIRRLANGQWLLEPDAVSWRQARLFIRFYRALHDRLARVLDLLLR